MVAAMSASSRGDQEQTVGGWWDCCTKLLMDEMRCTRPGYGKPKDVGEGTSVMSKGTLQLDVGNFDQRYLTEYISLAL